ncbi:hypothetical protein I4U23_020045 [Adineta vaga]|nr:hypothetical protein I4U23_020045 [Adineta vaga]
MLTIPVFEHGDVGKAYSYELPITGGYGDDIVFNGNEFSDAQRNNQSFIIKCDTHSPLQNRYGTWSVPKSHPQYIILFVDLSNIQKDIINYFKIERRTPFDFDRRQ